MRGNTTVCTRKPISNKVVCIMASKKGVECEYTVGAGARTEVAAHESTHVNFATAN